MCVFMAHFFYFTGVGYLEKKIKRLKIALFISILLLCQSGFYIADYIGVRDWGPQLDKMTFGNYDITIYYELESRFMVNTKEGTLTLSFENGAKVVSKDNTLIYQKDDVTIDLCEIGNKSYTIDEEGNLID